MWTTHKNHIRILLDSPRSGPISQEKSKIQENRDIVDTTKLDTLTKEMLEGFIKESNRQKSVNFLIKYLQQKEKELQNNPTLLKSLKEKAENIKVLSNYGWYLFWSSPEGNQKEIPADKQKSIKDFLQISHVNIDFSRVNPQERKKAAEKFRMGNPIDIFAKRELDYIMNHSFSAIDKGLFANKLASKKKELISLWVENLKEYLAVIETLETVVKKKEFQDNIWIVDGAVDYAKVAVNNIMASVWIQDRRKRELSKDRLMSQIQKGLDVAIKTWERQFIEIGVSKDNTETYQTYSISSIKHAAITNPEKELNRAALQTLMSFPDWKEKLGIEALKGIALYLDRMNYKSKIITDLPDNLSKEVETYFKSLTQKLYNNEVFQKVYDDSLFWILRKSFPTISDIWFQKVLSGWKINPKELLNLPWIPTKNPQESIESLLKIESILKGLKTEEKSKKEESEKELKIQGINTIQDILERYKIKDISIERSTRDYIHITSQEGKIILGSLQKSWVNPSDPLYKWLQSRFNIEGIDKTTWVVRATRIIVQDKGELWLEKVKSGDEKTIKLIDNASILYSKTEEIKEQSNAMYRTYADILHDYKLTTRDLQNPAIVINLIQKLEWKINLSEHEKDFLKDLKWIQSSHIVHMKATIEVVQNSENKKEAALFLNKVIEDTPKFSEETLRKYETIDRHFSSPLERPFNISSLEEWLVRMQPWIKYSGLSLGIDTPNELDTITSIPLTGYMFTQIWWLISISDEKNNPLITNVHPSSVKSCLTQISIMKMCWLDSFISWWLNHTNKVASSWEVIIVNSLDDEFWRKEMMTFLEKMFLIIYGKLPENIQNPIELIKEFRRNNPNPTSLSNWINSIIKSLWLIDDSGNLRIFDLWERGKSLQANWILIS